MAEASHELGAAGIEEAVQSSAGGSTTLLTQRGESVSHVPSDDIELWSDMSSHDRIKAYTELLDRWLPIHEFVWSTTQSFGGHIVSLELPQFVLDQGNIANLIPFYIYSYWQGDMEVKLVINANRFQMGQLQMSFYYISEEDKFLSNRANVYSRSQMQHCLVSASSNNEGTLYLAYKNYKPMLPIFPRDDQKKKCVMGNLSVFILVPLQTTSTVYKQCNGTLFIRFPRSTFSGLLFMKQPKLRDLEHQMLGMDLLGSLGQVLIEKYFMTGKKDKNRDNPPLAAPPSSIVAWSSHSWSIGDKCYEPINVLRLDGNGQTPFEGIVELDEMTVPFVTNIYGLVNQFIIDKNHKSGSKVFVIDVAPLLAMSHYRKADTTNPDINLTTYHIPPVGVVASMFLYWHGSIKFKFDFICSDFITARFMIGVVPRYMKGDITMDRLKSSSYAIVDLQETKSFTFIAPFISDKPWWPRRYHPYASEHVNFAPATLYIFVVNPIIPMDSVPMLINVNVYMAGGSDFEVSVPGNPILGLGSVRNVLYSKDTHPIVFVKKGYSPFYVGTWHNYTHGGVYMALLRWGTESDRICQLDSADIGSVYVSVPSGLIKGNPTRTTIANYDYMVPYHNSGYWYPFVFRSYVMASRFSKTYDFAEGDPYYGAGGEYITPPTGFLWRIYQPESNDVDSPIEIIEHDVLEHQMDQRSHDVSTTILTTGGATPQFGMRTFNEDFSSLKTLCRRYQFLDIIDFVVPLGEGIVGGFTMPICPQGLQLDVGLSSTSVLETNNRGRDGHVPIVASGYRLFRGSLRYRFIITEGDPNRVYFIQHRPDIIAHDHKVRKIVKITNATDVFLHSYAFLFQGHAVNQMIEFEVPFYQPGQYGLLQTPDMDGTQEYGYYCSLGTIIFGSTTPGPGTIAAFYKIADDMRFSLFQGFPPMVSVSDIVSNVNEHQMDPTPYIKIGMATCGLSLCAYGGLRLIKAVEHVSEETVKTMDKFRATCDDFKTDVSVQSETIGSSLSQALTANDSGIKVICIQIITNMAQVILNPTKESFITAFIGILTSVGLISVNAILKFSSCIKLLINRLMGNEHQAPMQDSGELQSYVSTLVSGVCLLFKKTFKISNISYANLAKTLLHGIKEFVITANCLTIFLRNNVKVIMTVYDWCLRKLYPRYNVITAIVFDEERITKWAREVMYLTDPAVRELCKIDMDKNIRVYDAAALAIEIMAGVAPMDHSVVNVPSIMNIIQKIIKLRDDLVLFKLSPPVRFEPFVLYFYGAPGVGKSFLCQHLDVMFLQSISYTTMSEPRFVVTPNNAYWNGLRNQPICQFDDFYTFDGEIGATECGYFMQLKSTAIFNPPQAEIESKHIRYNPLLVTVCSNSAYPSSTSMNSPEALWRRRDMLVEIICLHGSPAAAKANGINIDVFDHLRFVINFSHVDPRANNVSRQYNYQEFKELAIGNFKEYMESESVAYRSRLLSARALYPNEDILYLEDESLVYQALVDYDERARITEIRQLRTRHMNQVQSMCEHRRILIDQVEYDFETQSFANGDDIYSLSICERDCIWQICPELRVKELEYWVYTHQQIISANMGNNILPDLIEAIYSRITGRDMIVMLNLADRTGWRARYDEFMSSLGGLLKLMWEGMKVVLQACAYFIPFVGVAIVTNVAIGHGVTMLAEATGLTDRLDRINARRYPNEFQSMIPSGDQRNRGARRARIQQSLFSRPFQAFEHQSSEIMDFAKRVIRRNTFYIKAGMSRFRCIGIIEHYAVCPVHYFEFIRSSGLCIESLELHDGAVVPCFDLQATPPMDSTLCVFKVPVQVPIFKNFLNLMLKRTDFKNMSTMGYVVEADGYDLDVHHVNFKLQTDIVIPSSPHMGESVLQLCFNYPYGKQGACGAILLDSKLNHCVLGMHVGGSSASMNGFAECMFYDQFELLTRPRIVDVEDRLEHQCLIPNERNICAGLNFRVYGVLPKELGHHETGKTGLVPSILQGKIFNVVTEPGILSPRDVRNIEQFSPMREGIKKKTQMAYDFDDDSLQHALNYYRSMLFAKCKPLRQQVGVLSEQQAVCGIPNFEGYEHIELNSSEAFPFVCFRPPSAKDKRWLIDLHEDKDGYILKNFHPFLREVLDLKREQRKAKILPETVMICCLKQQCLPCDKAILPGKVRIFDMSPVDFTIEQRMYTLDFSAAFQQAKFSMYHALSIDTNSQEWGFLYRLLLEVGDNMIDGDFKAFGPGLNTTVVLAIYDLISDWYDFYGVKDDLARQIRWIMAHEMAQAKYLAFNTLFTSFCGSPSGSTLTTIVNTISNTIYLLVAWVDFYTTTYFKREKLFNFKHMFDTMNYNIRFVDYGDDKILSISNEVIDFNMIWIKNFFEQYGISFQAADKGMTEIKPYKSITEVTFLKSSFVYLRGYNIVLAKLPYESVSNSFNWVWNHPDLVAASLEASTTSMQLLVSYGREFYEETKLKLVHEFARHGVIVLIEPWDLEIAKRYLM
nr:MAG: polyprotein [Pseudoscorpian iflavirus 2]